MSKRADFTGENPCPDNDSGGKDYGRKPTERSPDQMGRLSRLVQRPVLQQSILTSLDHDFLAVICSEYGMGAHSASRLVADYYQRSGLPVTWLKLNSKSDTIICRRISSAVSSFLASFDSVGVGPSGLLVIDGLSIGDESMAIRAGRHISGALLAGAHVLIMLEPEFRYVMEYLPACRVYGARELLLSGSEIRKWCSGKKGLSFSVIREATHSIPALVDVIRFRPSFAKTGPSSREWDDCVLNLYTHALRSDLINEEWLIRFGMSVIGAGSFDDLRACGVRVSADLVAEVAQHCPLFGIQMSDMSFCCVDMSDHVLVEMLGRALDPGTLRWLDEAQPIGEFFTSAISLLVSRGAFRRAGILAQSNLAVWPVRELVLAYPLEFIDAGHLALVASAVSRCDGRRSQAEEILARLGVAGMAISRPETADGDHREVPASHRLETQQRLLELVDELCSNGDLALCARRLDDLSREVTALDDALSSKLCLHARVLSLALRGAELEAYRELVMARHLWEQGEGLSALSSVLCRDCEALGKLVGGPVSKRDAAAFKDATETLGSMGAAGLAEQSQAFCELSGALVGEKPEATSHNRILLRWHSSGKDRLAMWGRAIVSLGDSLVGQLQSAHVNAREALRLATRLGDGDAFLLSRMANACAMRGLGETPEKMDAPTSMEFSADMRALAVLHDALGRDDAPLLADVTSEMRGIPPRAGVMALSSLLVRADRVCGPRLAMALPLSWQGRVLPRAVSPSPSSHQRREVATAAQPARLSVCVLGGVSAWIDGSRIPEQDWRRTQAKMLLALLALAPGHLMQRHEVIELLWPDVDLARGRENLYTVLSSLRSTLGQTATTNRFVLGELGQIWLDSELVSCDVDEFERIARHVVSRRVEDDEAVSLCVTLEGMYGGGSFVPANDSLGRFRDRHEELTRRYRDALLVGVEAATRLRDARQAAWFAQSAKRLG